MGRIAGARKEGEEEEERRERTGKKQGWVK